MCWDRYYQYVAKQIRLQHTGRFILSGQNAGNQRNSQDYYRTLYSRHKQVLLAENKTMAFKTNYSFTSTIHLDFIFVYFGLLGTKERKNCTRKIAGSGCNEDLISL